MQRLTKLKRRPHREIPQEEAGQRLRSSLDNRKKDSKLMKRIGLPYPKCKPSV